MFKSKSLSFYYEIDRPQYFHRENNVTRTFFSPKSYTKEKLNRKIKELEINCGIHLNSAFRSANINEKISLKLLRDIVGNSDCALLQSLDNIDMLVRCSLVLVKAYVAHINIRVSFWDKFRRKPFADAIKSFHLLISKLMPDRSNYVIKTIMDFFRVERLWNVEFICCEILLSLLACRTSPNEILCNMLDYLEGQLRENRIPEARHVIQVLHKILYEKFWCKQTAAELKRLIKLYHDSVNETEMNETNKLFLVRHGFEACLVRLFAIIGNDDLIAAISHMFSLCFDTSLSPEGMSTFSHTLEYAIMYADVNIVRTLVQPIVLQYTLEAITSKCQTTSKLACRLLARLFDRHHNFAEFITPRIFLPNKYYKINISKHYDEDSEFFKRYKTEIEYHILCEVRQHRNASNLEIVFTILCTMLVGSPCGYTAIQVIAIALEIQEFALDSSHNASMTERNQMHAVVASIMTLVAWIHRSSTLSHYVQQILNRRADNAPHLNPPIKLTYWYAQNHIQWNEPNLFFDFWEVRYGLWKRFRTREPQLPIGGAWLTLQHPCDETAKNDQNRMRKAVRVQQEILTSNLVRESVVTLA